MKDHLVKAVADGVRVYAAVTTDLVNEAIRRHGCHAVAAAALGRTIGLSEPTVSRIVSGNKQIAPTSKEGELALLLVRVYRSLDALVGTDDQKRQTWMNTHNKALGGKPLQLVQKAEGLVATLNYLDGMRAPA